MKVTKVPKNLVSFQKNLLTKRNLVIGGTVKLSMSIFFFSFYFSARNVELSADSHCTSCTVVISNENDKAYTVSDGDVFCVLSEGRFTGSIQRLAGTSEFTLINAGDFQPKSISFNAGINRVENYGKFLPHSFVINPGTIENHIYNDSSAIFGPKEFKVFQFNTKIENTGTFLAEVDQMHINGEISSENRMSKSAPTLNLEAVEGPISNIPDHFPINIKSDLRVIRFYMEFDEREVQEVKLERSEDGSTFHVVNTQHPRSHSDVQVISDVEPKQGSAWYRLRYILSNEEVFVSASHSVSFTYGEFFSVLSQARDDIKLKIEAGIALHGDIVIYNESGEELERKSQYLHMGDNEVMLKIPHIKQDSDTLLIAFETPGINVNYPHLTFQRI